MAEQNVAIEQHGNGKPATGAGLPTHEIVYRKLRDRILYGEMRPGESVTIQGLSQALDSGMTPVREALRRMIAEGALAFQGNRRVTVPVMTAGNIKELIFARATIEPELIRLAAQYATAGDLDRLEARDLLLDEAIARGDVGAYLRHNHLFHEGLYDLAQAPILKSLAMGLWLRFGPSLRVVCGRLGTANLPDQHKETLAAMRRGDAEAAELAIRRDVMQGMEQMQRALEADGTGRVTVPDSN